MICFVFQVLLRRGNSREGKFIHTPNGLFDHDLFSLIWGPTVAALSFIFDKSSEPAILEKTMNGFRKCAMIAAYYGMSDVFDNLIISLCKFSSLTSCMEVTINTVFLTGFQFYISFMCGFLNRCSDFLKPYLF